MTRHGKCVQEQSQAPALGPAAVAGSAEALAGLIRLAKARSAQSVLLQTWAYAAGDPDNRALFPDYPTMQARARWRLALCPGAAPLGAAGSGCGVMCRTTAS